MKNMDAKKNNTNLVEERAQKVLENFSDCIRENGLIDVTKLACSLGFSVLQSDELSISLSGLITCNKESNQIAVNNNLSKKDKRYSIAYLLSTYLLYCQNQDSFTFEHHDSDEDVEAAYMARLLLIPDSVLETLCPNANPDELGLVDKFQVPYSIIEQRIEEISKRPKHPVLIKKNLANKKLINK